MEPNLSQAKFDQTVCDHSLPDMKTVGYTYWQDGKDWIGHLDEFPDYLTQGSSLEDLKAHLADLFQELTSGAIPNVRRHAVLELA